MLHDHQRGRAARDRKSRKPLGPRILDRVPNSLERGFVRDFLEHLGTPRALTVWMLYSSGEHRQLVELGIDPRSFECESRFKRDYAATKLLSKCAGLDTGIDTDEVAISAARAAEERCRTTNTYLRNVRVGACAPGPEEPVFHRARGIIANILGSIPPLTSLDENSEVVDKGWSSGRTTSAFGDNLSPTAKYAARPDVTIRARKYALQLLRDCPIWGSSVLDADGPASVLQSALAVVPGNVMRIVPKNAKTGRVICFEPHMNVRLQLSVGLHIRKRLKRFGVNLDDQSVNQRRAKLASVTGHLATIDLRSASDTLALELVYDLLPIDWAMFLDDLRSGYTEWPDGSTTKNEKFSSMGNGFTFELESLIFYALCSAVTSNVSVYGDDIILPVESASQAIEILKIAGFDTNTSKTFTDSHFRESCGEDAFRGLTVTPVYLRSRIRRVEDAVKLHNQVYAWAIRTGYGDRSLHAILAKWRRNLPVPLGPKGYGDGHLHCDFEDACPTRASNWVEGWWFSSYQHFSGSKWADGPKGLIPRRFGYSALCAGTGPKPQQSIWASEADRRRKRTVKIRVLATSWPGAIWV